MDSNSEKRSLFFVSFSYILFFTNPFVSIGASLSQASLSQGQQLKHGEQLVSDSGTFRLRFFSHNNCCYLGTWYDLDSKTNTKPFWVANRNTPIFGDSVVLTIDDNGSLVIKYDGGKALPLYSVENATSTIATLEESGNFVLRDITNNRVLWESFDHPTDSLLPGMKLGFNKRTGQNWSLTSWRSDNLPALGSFSFGIHPNHTNQLTIWWRGYIYWTSGPWQQDGTFKYANSLSISYNPYNFEYANSYLYNSYCRRMYNHDYAGYNFYMYNQDYAGYNFHYHTTEDEVYFSYSVNKSLLYLGPNQQVPRLSITPLGEVYKADGQTAVSCSSWSISGYSKYHLESNDGCVERKSPECRWTEGTGSFVTETGVMSTEGFKFGDSENLTIYDCAAKCWNNCSCLAYASTNYTYGTGCEIWREVTSFKPTFENPGARDIYFYNHESSYSPFQTGDAASKWWISLIVLGVLIALPILCYVCYVIWKKCKAEVERIMKRTMLIREIGGRTVVSILYDITKRRSKAHKTDNEIQIFSFRSIVTATKKFSEENKLGEGGFGSVYKGKLRDGQEIAIKRLSKRSGQGLVEFKNEAILIAKLQHTSLVRLLGFCVQREERILVYEYMTNKSLDFYLFDSEKKKILN